jgi:hypothetical protein
MTPSDREHMTPSDHIMCSHEAVVDSGHSTHSSITSKTPEHGDAIRMLHCLYKGFRMEDLSIRCSLSIDFRSWFWSMY